MTQMTSLLAVATVYIGLWTLMSDSTFYCQRGGGGAYTQDKTTCTYAGTGANNSGGGPMLMCEGARGIIAGFYSLHRGYGDVYMHSTYMCNCL